MKRLEETNMLIDYMGKLREAGVEIDNTVLLADSKIAGYDSR